MTDAPEQEAVEPDQATPEPAEVEATRPTGRRLFWSVLALAVTITVLAAALVVGAVIVRHDSQRNAARQAAVAAARQEALNLTSIDGQNIDADLQRVLDNATGGFRTDFAARSKDLKTVLVQNKVVSQGRVLEAALVRSDLTTATALVVVDSTVKNTAAPKGRANTYRMMLDLELHGNRWLTSSLQFVG